MKKVLFLLAVAGMFSFAACNNNTEATEETNDSACAQEMVEEVAEVAEEVIDTTAVAVEEVATEEVVSE